MNVRVDQARCQGHTLCAMIAPEHFELDDVDGHARAINPTADTSEDGLVHEAVRSCPEQAIRIA